MFGTIIAVALLAAFAITFALVRANKTPVAAANSSYPASQLSHGERYGTLRLETDPLQSAIWINGELRAETTPSTIDKLPLAVPIEIKLTKEGYGAYRKTITLTESAPNDTLNATLPKATLTLTVSTNVASPTFYIDGKQVPGPKIEGITANEEHRVTVASAGYAARSMTFMGGPNDTKTITLDLDRDEGAKHASKSDDPPPSGASSKGGVGKLNIGSRGGFCTASVDGTSYGVTPVGGITLPAGPHRVSCRSDGGKSYSQSVSIEPDQTARVSFSLAD
jgi:serine/threonine-protein kinase